MNQARLELAQRYQVPFEWTEINRVTGQLLQHELETTESPLRRAALQARRNLLQDAFQRQQLLEASESAVHVSPQSSTVKDAKPLPLISHLDEDAVLQELQKRQATPWLKPAQLTSETVRDWLHVMAHHKEMHAQKYPKGEALQQAKAWVAYNAQEQSYAGGAPFGHGGAGITGMEKDK